MSEASYSPDDPYRAECVKCEFRYSGDDRHDVVTHAGDHTKSTSHSVRILEP